jgi:hypothetical protein
MKVILILLGSLSGFRHTQATGTPSIFKRSQTGFCQQVHCQTSVCATDVNDAATIASSGLEFIIAEDCGTWSNGSPTNNGQGSCSSSLSSYTGDFVIWRAWVDDNQYSGSFASSGQFLGATCNTEQSVKCTGNSGTCPGQGGLCTVSC